MTRRVQSAGRPPLLLRRAAARFFDAGVLLLTAFVLLLVLRRTDMGEQEIAALSSLLAAWAWWLYETVLTAARGATIGKRLTNIRVVDEAGQALSPLRAGIRALPVLLLLDVLLSVGALIVWSSAAILPDGRGLHDRLARTTVVPARWRPDADRP